MARPKGKLIALVAVFAAIGLVTASGAFTSVSAQRTVSVDVAGDADAALGLAANDSSGVTGSDYVSTASSGEIEIDLTDGNLPNSAKGLNANATTTFDSLLTVTNNGNQAIEVDIEVEPSGSLPSGVTDFTLYKASDDTTNLDTTDGGSAITIGSGSSEGVGLLIELDDTVSSTDSFTIDITINANPAP